MSTDTPSESITALLAYSQADEEGIIVTVSRQAIHEVVRENARLREDEKGLLQDIARLTEEAFKRDEELAEAKRAAIDYMEKWHKAIHQRDAAQVTANLLQHAQAAIDAERKRAEKAEARALANEKDAGRLRWLLEDHEHPATRELRNSLLNRMQVMSYSAACTDIDAAIAGAKHD